MEGSAAGKDAARFYWTTSSTHWSCTEQFCWGHGSQVWGTCMAIGGAVLPQVPSTAGAGGSRNFQLRAT